MNVKRFDRKGQWGIDTAKRYFHREFINHDFKGIMGLLYFDDVSEPRIWQYPRKSIKVCTKGMRWLQFIPYNENYAINAMINAENIINLWYIDVISGYGYTDDNVVYFSDLYIDIILHPDGECMTDESDEELKEALAENEINQELYNLALSTKEKLLNGVLADINSLTQFCIKYLNLMENK